MLSGVAGSCVKYHSNNLIEDVRDEVKMNHDDEHVFTKISEEGIKKVTTKLPKNKSEGLDNIPA